MSETVMDKINKLNNETESLWAAYRRMEEKSAEDTREARRLAVIAMMAAVAAAILSVIF